MLLALAAALLAALAWAYLLAGHGWFWRTNERLPAASASAANRAGARSRTGTAGPGPDRQDRPSAPWPDVVAVVPARNEAAVLPEALPTLLSQDYPGRLRVILVDDESSDDTAKVAASLTEQAQAGDPRLGDRLQVVAGEPLPPGWAGKVWAMDQGLRAAGDAEYILFTDADIAYRPGTITALVRSARASGKVLVSQMALLRADAFWERLLIPAFVYFFAQLYPFGRINKPGARTAGAAGGCMLVRREALEAAGGLEPIKGARIDDVALGGLLKRPPSGGDCWLGFSTDVISQRRYAGLAEIWDMVARSAYTQLRYSPLALAGTVAGMVLLYLVPVAATASGLALLLGGPGTGVPAGQAAWLAGAGLTAWAIMSVTYVPVLRLSRLSPLRAPLLPAIGVLYTGMTISSARRHRAGRGGEWKGRTIQR